MLDMHMQFERLSKHQRNTQTYDQYVLSSWVVCTHFHRIQSTARCYTSQVNTLCYANSRKRYVFISLLFT